MRVGTLPCFLLGETEPPDLTRTFLGGFDARCYRTPLDLVPTTLPLVSISDRATITELARIQEALYNDAAGAAVMLSILLGPDSVVSFVPDSPTSSFSGSLIGISPTQTIVMSSGTTNQQQFAFQFLYGASGPTDYGSFSTNAQWFANATELNNRMVAAGVDLSKPITFVGHSYGGATVNVLAGQILLAHPNAELQIFTTGTPRSGDQRLYDLIETRPIVNVVADGDPVASIPPVGVELYPFFLFAPAPLYAQWQTVAKPRNVLMIDGEGNLREGNPYLLSYSTISQAVMAAIALDPQPVYANHLSGYYYGVLKMHQRWSRVYTNTCRAIPI